MSLTEKLAVAVAVAAFLAVAVPVVVFYGQRLRDRIREARRKAIIAEWEENYW